MSTSPCARTYAFCIALGLSVSSPLLAFAQERDNPFERRIVPASAAAETPIDIVAPERSPRSSRYEAEIVSEEDSLLGGTWALQGEDRQGPFRGEIRFVPQRDGRSYDYERTQEGSGRLERGTAQVHNGHVFLHEEPQNGDALGLSAALNGDQFFELNNPLRRGMFRLRDGGQALDGQSWITTEPGRSRETLRRPGLDAANNDVELLIDGPEAFPAIYEAMENAESSICLQTFSWFEDGAGQKMVDLLASKVRDGVTVRCLVEAFPQFGGMIQRHETNGWAFWRIDEKLEAAGVEIIIQNKFMRGLGTSIKRNFRKLFGLSVSQEERGFLTHDHRKLIVVDGRIAFTGGMNIGDKYEAGTTWHDVHAAVRGSAVPKLEAMFYDRWHVAGGEGEALPPVEGDPWPGNLEVIVQENLPGVRLDVTDSYLEEIRGARHEILIENPYFLYDPVVNALKKKASEGVRTTVILPSNDLNDEALARDAFYFIQNDILNAGVELYKYRDRMCHGKVAVFDGARATMGTTNLDQMAMERNAELNIFVRDRGFADYTIERVFEADIPKSDRIEVQKLSWWSRVKGFVMHSLRRFL